MDTADLNRLRFALPALHHALLGRSPSTPGSDALLLSVLPALRAECKEALGANGATSLVSLVPLSALSHERNVFQQLSQPRTA